MSLPAQTCYIPARELEQFLECQSNFFSNSLQCYQGGAIFVYPGATCNIDGASFVSNTAADVSRAAEDLESCRADLLYPCPGFSQLFFSFLTFLLLFAQYGGAIYNAGTLAVKYGNFTGNSAPGVCILASHSQRSQLAISLPGIYRAVLEKLELTH
jgi:hypothetical protein